MNQLNFLDIVEPTPNQVAVKVYQCAPDLFQATINGGWWMAYGRTVAEAVERVKRVFGREMGYFRRRNNELPQMRKP